VQHEPDTCDPRHAPAMPRPAARSASKLSKRFRGEPQFPMGSALGGNRHRTDAGAIGPIRGFLPRWSPEADGKKLSAAIFSSTSAVPDLPGIGPINRRSHPTQKPRHWSGRLMLAVLGALGRKKNGLAGVRLVQSALPQKPILVPIQTDLSAFDSRRSAVRRSTGNHLGIKFCGYDVRPGERDGYCQNAKRSLCEAAYTATTAGRRAGAMPSPQRTASASSSIWVR